MKTQTKLLAMLLVLAICLVIGQTINAADDKDKKAGDDLDALLEGNAGVSDRGDPGMGSGGDMGRGRGAPGMGRGIGGRGGPGMGRGDMGGMGQGGFGGRFGGMADEATLHDFLVEFEPTLAAKLEALSVDNPKRFDEQLPSLLRLYSPVIRQMDRDPEGGELSLKKISLRMRIQKIVAKAKDADKAEKTKAQRQLREPVGQLFDVIIKEEGLRLEQSAERLESFSERVGRGTGIDRGRGRGTGMGARDGRGADRGPGMGMGSRDGRGAPGGMGARDGRGANRGPGMGMGSRDGRGAPGGMDRRPDGAGREPDIMGRNFGPEMFRNRIEERKTAIASWKESKEQIVTDRTKQLLGGYEEFPWGR